MKRSQNIICYQTHTEHGTVNSEETFNMEKAPNYASDGEWADASNIVKPDDSVSVAGAGTAMPILSPATAHAVATTADTANTKTVRARYVEPQVPRAAADTPFSAPCF